MESGAPSHEDCCRVKTTACPCPLCGSVGRKVGSVTLDRHVALPLRGRLGDEAAFCPNPACEAVYCSPGRFVVRRGQTVLPVTVKDAGDQVPVCYCFGFTRGELRRDLAEGGHTDIPDRIRQGVSEGRCACESENPQGACCLGNVAGAIKELQREAKGRG